MLRARALRARSDRYVCDLCRRGLSTAGATSKCRPTKAQNEAAVGSVLPILFQAARRPRYFSKTLSLLESNGDGQSSSKPSPGGFPGSFGGGFGGSSAGSFGGFGMKKPAATDTSAQNGGLLPHEREARQKTAPVEPPRPKPTDRQGQRDQLQRNPNQKPSSRFQNRDNRERQFQTPRNQEQADKSRAALNEIFKKSQENRRTRQPDTAPLLNRKLFEGVRKTEVTKPEVTTASTASSAWGRFSARKTNTAMDDPNAPSKSGTSRKPIRASASSVSGRSSSSEQNNADWPASDPFGPMMRNRQADKKIQDVGEQGNSKSSSANAWDEMTRARRVEPSSKAKKKKVATPDSKEEESFWDALEGRVNKPVSLKKTGKLSPEQQAELLASATGFDAPSTINDSSYNEQTQTRKKSRFEIEEEESGRGARKSDKRKKDQRGSRGRFNEREDERDDGERWEQQQRKKEEKRLRKLQEAQQEEVHTPTIFLPEFISVGILARSLKRSPRDFLNDLEEMGFENMTDDTIMTGETAALISMEYGFDPTVDNGSERDLWPRPIPEDVSALPSRPPIVTIMGHVDHGKTTLLDWLRKSSIAAQEHGGITQHIGAFVVKMSSGKAITFLDTPGHAAFLSMRQRGANVTDIVVLVVAADDSVKPQTLEALKHATNAKVPIIVAINKIDKEDARIEQVKADLSRNGVEIEDYGGDVQVVCVSGKTGQGMEDLEENIVTLSEILDTRAEEDGMAEGWVLESSVKQDGKVATVLVKRGTLRTGDVIVAGKSWARVRLLRNEAGVEMAEAPPGTPVEVLGWRELPDAGTQVLQAPDEDRAKTAIEYREEMAERQKDSAYLAEQEQRQREKAAADAAAAEEGQEASGDAVEDTGPKIVTQNFVVKADVAGSVEAVCASVLEQGNNEVQSKILRSGIGQISEYDVDHAAASNSIIVNFNSPIQPHIKSRANEAGVRIIDHSVIYHLVDETRDVLTVLLPKKYSNRVIAEADVLQVFPINVRGRVYRNIAGCKVRNGSIKKGSLVKIIRKGEVVYDGKVDTLKHVKKNVSEMGKGSECGMGFEEFEELEVDDQIQTYEVVEEKRHL